MHTPGPWEVDSGMVQTAYDHSCKIPGCGSRIPIAWMDRKPGNGTMPVERDENACLISAAPEMYEILQALKLWYDAATDGKHVGSGPNAYSLLFDDERSLQEHISAVIAKVKGK